MLDLQKQKPVISTREQQKTLEQQKLTTQEAADLLNVPEPYLLKLLEDGDLPFKLVGLHRRINLEDLLKYKEKRDKKRHELLTELTQLSEEYGLYDCD